MADSKAPLPFQANDLPASSQGTIGQLGASQGQDQKGQTQWPSPSSRPSTRSIFRPRDFRERIFYAFAALFICWYSLRWWGATQPTDPIEAILNEVPLIDTHIDFPIYLRAAFQNHIYNFSSDDALPGQVDFPRLRKGRLGAAFWSVWVPCPEDDGDYSDERYADSVTMTFSQIDLVQRLVTHFGDQLTLTTNSYSIFQNHQYPPPYRTVGSVIGGEGLHSIGNSVSNLRLFHALGMRYMTLTHNCHNAYADAAISPHPPVHGGLSKRGRALLLEFNRLGMMIDLSHVSAETMRQALDVTEAPVIFSHSGAYGVNAHPRNVPDDVLDRVKANGGVVQAVFLPEFVRTPADGASLADVADHIEYIGRRIGFEHVGIGSDFDGMPKSVDGLEDVAAYPDLLRELWRRGVSYKDLAGVAGNNLLRVMQQVERVALESTRLPLEDDVHFGFNSSELEDLAPDDGASEVFVDIV